MQHDPRRSTVAAALAFVLWSAACFAAGAEADGATASPAGAWRTDLDPARVDAVRSGADLVLLLTREQQETPALPTAAPADAPAAIRVRLDWPAEPPAHPAEARLFLTWADRYSVGSLPAMLLLDTRNRAYGLITSEQIRAGQTAQAIEAARARRAARDLALADASTLTGLDKARALDRALAEVDAFILLDYRGIAEQIVALDADGSAGLRDKYQPRLAAADLDEFIQNAIYPMIDQGQYAKAREALDRVLKDWPLSKDNRQLLLGFQAQLFYSEGDKVKALAMLDRAIAEAPDSATSDKLRHARSQMHELPVPNPAATQ